MDEEVEIPSYFVCSISLQIMQDPVTVCTGVTYERESIEKWMYELGKNTCPATMRVLDNKELTPNHTLRRLIHHWCAANSNSNSNSMGIATAEPPLDNNRLNELLRDIESFPPPPFLSKMLKTLRNLAERNEVNRRCISSSRAPAVLISVIETQSEETVWYYDVAVACEEALGVLHALHLPDEALEPLATGINCLVSLGSVLKRGTSNARFHAAMLLHKVSMKGVERLVKNGNDDLIEGLLELVTEEVCQKATVAALEVLSAMSTNSQRSRMKAIEAGAVSILIESLAEQSHETKKSCERMLCLLDVLCRCAEGRVAMVDNAMGVPVISKKIFRVSSLATEKAVQILWSLCQFCPSERVLEEVLQAGAVTKLLMLLQLDCTPKTKCKAVETLKLHGSFWRSLSCVPSGMYPSKLC